MVEQVKDNVSWDMYFKSHEQVIKDYKIGKISFIELEKYIEELMEEYYIVRSEYFERFGKSED